jgi:hypothetical protein
MLEHQRGAATQMFLSWLRDGQNMSESSWDHGQDLDGPGISRGICC